MKILITDEMRQAGNEIIDLLMIATVRQIAISKGVEQPLDIPEKYSAIVRRYLKDPEDVDHLTSNEAIYAAMHAVLTAEQPTFQAVSVEDIDKEIADCNDAAFYDSSAVWKHITDTLYYLIKAKAKTVKESE